jgi:TolB protein
MLSMEQRRDGPGRPFDEYYTQTPTHLWEYDLDRELLEEICREDRIAPFTTPALLLSNGRLLVQVVKNRVGQIYSVKLDGSDPREFTKAGEGLPYGLSLSPDGKRVAYHLASPDGYQVWTSDLDGTNRVRLAAASGHLYFGTNWSPDGEWVLYVDCQFPNDPGHDWADVCIGRPDGTEHKVLTTGQAMWFAATYGNPQSKGGGSNVPVWTNAGEILFPQREKDSRVPWQYKTGQPDVDHFNREFKPESSLGSTRIVRLNPGTGSITPITNFEAGRWDFRGSQSPDGTKIVFCRAKTGESPAIWVIDSDARNLKLVTKGLNELGADHPRWIP